MTSPPILPDHPDWRDQQIRYLRAREELQRRRKQCPLGYFTPHEKQQQFFSGLKEHRGMVKTGGNRSGKSVANAVTCIEHAYGYRIHEVPDLRLTADGDYPPRNEIPPEYWIRRPDGVPIRMPGVGIVVTGLSLPKGVGKIMWPEIRDWLPEALIPKLLIQRTGNPSTVTNIKHPTYGWEMIFGSVEQGSMQFEGIKYDWAAFDEPPHRSVFTAVWRGLIDFYSPFWLTFTPLGSHAPWLYEEFFTGERDDVGIVQVMQDDNPFLTPDARAAFLEGVKFTDEELLARKAGEFGFRTHRAFAGYDRDVHFIDAFRVPPEWPRLLVCDPASRRPFYFVWLAFDVDLRDWHAYREFPTQKLHHQYRTSNWTIQDYATIIRNAEGGERIAARVLDPRFGKARFHIKGVETTSVQEDFARFGLMFDVRVPDTKLEETGIQRIRELFWYDKNMKIDSNNRPHLYVHDCCQSLDFALMNYSFVPPDLKDDRVLPEKTKEAFKDPIDALRYGLLYGIPGVALHGPDGGYFSQKDLENENAIDDSWL